MEGLQIPYEQIMSVEIEAQPVGQEGCNRTEYAWVEYDPNLQNLDVAAGDDIAIEGDPIEFSGQYKVEAVRRSTRGYEQVKIKISNPPGQMLSRCGIPFWFLLIDPATMGGRIHFGKRNVITAGGGRLTQVAGSDLFMAVLLLGVLAVVIGVSYEVFIKEQPAEMAQAA